MLSVIIIMHKSCHILLIVPVKPMGGIKKTKSSTLFFFRYRKSDGSTSQFHI